jgi:hypothetical protein
VPNGPGNYSNHSFSQRDFKSLSNEPDSATFRVHNLGHTGAILLFSRNIEPKIVQDAEPPCL